MIQWLRLCTSNASSMGSIPGQGTKVCTKAHELVLAQRVGHWPRIIPYFLCTGPREHCSQVEVTGSNMDTHFPPKESLRVREERVGQLRE